MDNITLSRVKSGVFADSDVQFSWCLTYYRIEQNFGGKKIWRNCDFETLAEKTLANPRLACIFVLHRECWRKKLGEL